MNSFKDGNTYEYNKSEWNQLDTLPINTIIMWWPNPRTQTVPKGWKICDGAPGTPNLTHKFVRGVGSAAAAGKVSGSNAVKLVEKNLPDHTHSISHHHFTGIFKNGDPYQWNKYPRTRGSFAKKMDFDGKSLGSSVDTPGKQYFPDIDDDVDGDEADLHTGLPVNENGVKVENSGSDGMNGTQFSIIPSHYTLIFIIKTS